MSLVAKVLTCCYVLSVVVVASAGVIAGNGLLVVPGILIALPAGLIAAPVTFVSAILVDTLLRLGSSSTGATVVAVAATALVYGGAATCNLVVFRQMGRSVCRRQLTSLWSPRVRQRPLAGASLFGNG